ncbi:transposase [Blastopirellula retiformator]|uniref:Transposase IS200 like protein n=1 Tax=Blastopirellula retiformator TaxID=2527970 RepID=A0A5C5V301_9BACT|nr:transposase [Blastopirellula retiformator]TWT32075.1 Transposase IS200 like protein [Blastopirellula retiformator]
MPRQKRADEAGAIYHTLNRGNARQALFRKPEDYDAFLRTLGQGLERYPVELFSFTLMPNHWHLVLRPAEDGMMGRLLRWVTATHTQRYHAHYHTAGEGHLYQSRFKSFPIADDDHFLTVCRYVERNPLRANLVKRAEDWRYGSLFRWSQKSDREPKLLSAWPIARSPKWIERVNQPLSEKELAALRQCVSRGRPFGNEKWTEKIARKSGLEYTLRSRGRPRKTSD